MPKGHNAKKRNTNRKKVVSPLDEARALVANYSGLVARIAGFHKLGGDTDADRFFAVADLYAKKEKEVRERPDAF